MAGGNFFRNLVVNPFKGIIRSNRRIDRRPDNRGQKAPRVIDVPARRDLRAPPVGDLIDWKNFPGQSGKATLVIRDLDELDEITDLTGIEGIEIEKPLRTYADVELPVTSSWIASLQFSPNNPYVDPEIDPHNTLGTIHIRQRQAPDGNGKTMHYRDMPFDLFDDWYAAGSKGEFYNIYVKYAYQNNYLGST